MGGVAKGFLIESYNPKNALPIARKGVVLIILAD